jgi:hypothetical protein
MVSPKISTHICWLCCLCGKRVSLEECKIDEYGLPVHEECYVVLILWGKEKISQKAA